MRAFGADDGKPNRTPTAWMMTLRVHVSSPVLGVVSSAERYWVTLAPKRVGFNTRFPLLAHEYLPRGLVAYIIFVNKRRHHSTA
jgi:hypothetical protein